jgi:predicted nucleotidyltransferase
MSTLESDILKRFKNLLLQKVKVTRMILFGSRARGDAEEDSHMDVLVILDEQPDKDARSYVSRCAWEAGFEEGIVVVPIVYGRQEWEQGPERFSLLAQAVGEEGISI